MHLASSLLVYSLRLILAHKYLHVNPLQLFVVQVFIVNKFNVDIKFSSSTEVRFVHLFVCAPFCLCTFFVCAPFLLHLHIRREHFVCIRLRVFVRVLTDAAHDFRVGARICRICGSEVKLAWLLC